MEPSEDTSKWRTANDHSSIPLMPSQTLPKNIRCPRGTVPIKRIQEEDLAMEKVAPTLKMTFSALNSSKSDHPKDNQALSGHDLALLGILTNNTGVYGEMNVWVPEVQADQFSAAHVLVASDSGSNTNAIVAGWIVNPHLDKDNTQLYTFWTKDDGKSTGCYNILCPGFVQTNPDVPLGVVIKPASNYGGEQYHITISVEQDIRSNNWWLFVQGQGVGYWPKELFTTLGEGATMAGWGGEVYSPPSSTKPSPSMGSGHFPNEGFRKACFIKELEVLDTNHKMFIPEGKDLRMALTSPECYQVMFYGGDAGGSWGRYMFFGGPPNCKIREQ